MAKITEAAENVDLEMYEMGLNSTVRIGGIEITRVPGGWIYAWALGEIKKDKPLAMAMAFVPFNTEFNPNVEH